MADELERIKLKKMEEMRKQMKQKQRVDEDRKKLGENKKKVLEAALMPDAHTYLEELRKRDLATATEIENLILRAVLSQRLKYKLEAIEIEALERRIKGVESRIVIKRRGDEEIDLTDKLKRDKENQN